MVGRNINCRRVSLLLFPLLLLLVLEEFPQTIPGLWLRGGGRLSGQIGWMEEGGGRERSAFTTARAVELGTLRPQQ